MGLSMTSARMLRLFTISSRSPGSRFRPTGNTKSLDGTGTSPGEETTATGAACCFVCSILTGESAFLPQAITRRRANKGNANSRTWRDEVEVLDIHSLLYHPLFPVDRNQRNDGVIFLYWFTF